MTLIYYWVDFVNCFIVKYYENKVKYFKACDENSILKTVKRRERINKKISKLIS